MDFDELKPYLRRYVESITKESRGGLYVCPFCGSGTGVHGTGAFSIDRNDPTRWKCFSCERSGDIYDLIGEYENIPERAEQFRRASELYGRNQNQPKTEQPTHTHTHTHTEEPTSLEPYFAECQKRLGETDYHTRRGISEAVAVRFRLGYDPHYKVTGGTEWKALIIPTGENNCTARNTNPINPERYRRKGNSVPLNWQALQTAEKPIYIVEGEIDALSIIEAGGEAIGLGSKSNVKLFTDRYVKKHRPAHALILALDNDEEGQKATEELETRLEELGVSCYRYDPYNGHKDANEALTADRDEFIKAVAQGESMEAEAQEAERRDYMENSALSHMKEFLDKIGESVNTPAQPTGFKKLDAVLDGGLYEGLYILGAVTSLGKTTLALQIADQIAESGRDVLIFSLEMARTELMSKSISRETLIDVLNDPAGDIGNAKTNRGITAGARYEHYSQTERELIIRSMDTYGEYAQHIYIQEGIGNIGTAEIREAIEKHQRITGQAPVVLVDYLQILAPYDVRATDKMNTDKAVLELKRISRDYKIPVIGISSFNRASYKERVTLEAFKESGAIEYGSDVLIGLQFKGAGSKDFNDTEAKRKDPREVELVILKNRNGRTGDTIEYNYYPLFNYFKEEDGQTVTRQRKRY